MITNLHNKFTNIRVPLDNSFFQECEFEGCTLEYAGSGPVSMVGCKFSNVRWEFVGSAANTLAFLHGLFHGLGDGGRKLVDAIIDSRVRGK